MLVVVGFNQGTHTLLTNVLKKLTLCLYTICYFFVFFSLSACAVKHCVLILKKTVAFFVRFFVVVCSAYNKRVYKPRWHLSTFFQFNRKIPIHVLGLHSFKTVI